DFLKANLIPEYPMKKKIDNLNYSSWLAGASEMKRLVFQALDLRDDDDDLAKLPPATTEEDACVFLGCEIGPRLAAILVSHRATVFPKLTGHPYDPYRSALYTWRDLMDGFNPVDPGS